MSECKCGKCKKPIVVEYSNKSNEEGEDYYEIFASCDHCNIEYETSGWGNFENQEDADDAMNEYIEEMLKKQNNERRST